MDLIIENRLEFDASPARVWRAIAESAEIAEWFGDTAALNPTPGGEGTFGWNNHGTFAVRVEVADPPTRLHWRWAKDPGVPIGEGVSTLVEWSLTERADGGTILELRESGFVEGKHHEDNTGGWQAELAELELFLSREV